MEYNKIFWLRRKNCQLIIFHDTHPDDVNDNDEHPNDIDNIDAEKKGDASNNDMLCNDVNNSDTNSNNFNNNGSDNANANNIYTEKNIENVELCYSCKHLQSAHFIKKIW